MAADEQKQETMGAAEKVIQALELIKATNPDEPFQANRLEAFANAIPERWVMSSDTLPSAPNAPLVTLDEEDVKHDQDHDDGGGGGSGGDNDDGGHKITTLRSRPTRVPLVDQL
jgi:hypothetical protein